MNDRFIEDLKSRLDIVEVVKKYTSLKKAGKNFMGKSPFRNERTPSFSVSPERQFWYDFGASEGGDVISFVEKIENCSFPEAVEILAESAGVEIPKLARDEKRISRDEKKDIFALHKKASEFFAKELQKSRKASEYLKNRGFGEAVWKKWNLGYGGDNRDELAKFLLSNGFSESKILESGVAFARDFGDKKIADRFWGRVLVSIGEPKNGEIIAFSGRDILDREKVGKYVNSPENPVYHKSSTLFGLDKARAQIRELDRVILVEGNFDVIAMHEAGFENTVATCGTALTDDHLRALSRLTKNFILAFDSDLAGKKATLKSVEMILKMGGEPLILDLPSGKDVDEFLREEGNANELQKLIKNCPKALDFLFEKFGLKNLNGSIDGEKRFLDSFFYFLNLVSRPVELDFYLGKLAEKLHRGKSIVESEFSRFQAQKSKYEKEKFSNKKSETFSAEQKFLGFLFENWDFFAKTVAGQKAKIFELLEEEFGPRVLEKKLAGKDLESDEFQKILAWEMFIRNESLEESNENLKEKFLFFINFLKKEKAKRGREEAAKNFRGKYRGGLDRGD